MTIVPPHPAYGPHLPGNILRGGRSGDFLQSDPDKGAKVIYELSRVSDLPLRVPLGKDSLEAIRGKVSLLTDQLGDARIDAWSADLE